MYLPQQGARPFDTRVEFYCQEYNVLRLHMHSRRQDKPRVKEKGGGSSHSHPSLKADADGFQTNAKLAEGDFHKEELCHSMDKGRTRLGLFLLTCKLHIVEIDEGEFKGN